MISSDVCTVRPGLPTRFGMHDSFPSEDGIAVTLSSYFLLVPAARLNNEINDHSMGNLIPDPMRMSRLEICPGKRPTFSGSMII